MTDDELTGLALRPVIESIFIEFIPPYVVDGDTLEIILEGTCVSYDLLATLSDKFRTKNINVRSERMSSGGCETCNFEWDETHIIIADIPEWPAI